MAGRGFFPNGITGLVMAMAVIMFSFGGLELVGITAAEADEPHKTIPKATNRDSPYSAVLRGVAGGPAVTLPVAERRGRGSPLC